MSLCVLSDYKSLNSVIIHNGFLHFLALLPFILQGTPLIFLQIVIPYLPLLMVVFQVKMLYQIQL